MKLRFKPVVAAAAVAGALLLAAWGPTVRAEGRAVAVSGTIYGTFDYSQGAWVGHAILRFGDGDPLKATFVDRNTSLEIKKNGVIEGTETITMTFANGSGTFEIPARFRGVPGSTPNLYTLHEVGTIANGTGTYANLAGHLSVQGPFLFPDPESTPGAPAWIAEIHGAATGLN